MRPASTQRPRESRDLPHRPARAPATWKAPDARISGRGPLRGLTEARAPSGRSLAHCHGPRPTRRERQEGEDYAEHSPLYLPPSLHEAHLKDSDPTVTAASRTTTEAPVLPSARGPAKRA